MGRGGEAQASGSPPEVRSHAIRVNPRFVLKDPRRVSALSRHRRASLVPSHPRPEDTYYPPHARGNFPNPSIRTPLSPPSHPILPNQHSGTSSSWAPASRAPPSPTPSATKAATSSSSSEISPNRSASSANFYNPVATSSSKNSAWNTAWTKSTRRKCTATPCTRTAARRSWGTRSRGAATT